MASFLLIWGLFYLCGGLKLKFFYATLGAEPSNNSKGAKMTQDVVLTADKLFTTREGENEMDEVFDDFCERDLKPLASRALQHHELSEEVFDESVRVFQKLGTHAFAIPQKYGGEQITARMLTSFTRKVCRVPGAADLGLSVGAGNSLFNAPLFNFGSEDLKAQLAPELLAGKDGCFAQTEGEAGSHVAGIRAKAVLGQDGIWRITGTKRFITGGWKANYALVLAISDPQMHEANEDTGMTVFIVDCDEERARGTLDTSKNEHKLGLTHSPTTEMIFTESPAFAILGPLHDGYRKVNLTTLCDSRATVIAGQAVGIGESAYDEALRYAKERKAFGQSIYEKHAIRDGLLLDMEARNRIMWALTLQSSTMKDEFPSGDSRPYDAQASLAKLVCGEYVRKVATQGLQVFGGNGYILDYAIGRILNDSYITAIYEGTSQVQSMLVARGFLKAIQSGVLTAEPHDVVRIWPFAVYNFRDMNAWDDVAYRAGVYERRMRFFNTLQQIIFKYPIENPRNLPAPYFAATEEFGSLEGATIILAGRRYGAKEFSDVSDEVVRRAFAIADGEFEQLESTYLR